MSADPDGVAEGTPLRQPTPRAQKVLRAAQEIAVRHGHSYVGVEHLLRALLDSGPSVASAALDRARVDRDLVREALDELMAPESGRPEGHE